MDKNIIFKRMEKKWAEHVKRYCTQDKGGIRSKEKRDIHSVIMTLETMYLEAHRMNIQDDEIAKHPCVLLCVKWLHNEICDRPEMLDGAADLYRRCWMDVEAILNE